MRRSILVILVMWLLSGCSVYKSSFGCGDAKGAECYAMDYVDGMISSGEIDRFNEAYKKCKGRRCRQNSHNGKVIIPDQNKKSSVNIHRNDEFNNREMS